MGMATGDDDQDQSEQPAAATEADAVASPAGGTSWFAVDPSPEGFERSDADQRGPAPTVDRPGGRDPSVDRPAAPPGPDLISAGMVHVDPEPGIDPPGGPDPRPDRPGGYDASGDGPAAAAAAVVERESGVREPDRDAEPVPWTEPALPMPWPTPVEGRAGGANGGVAEDVEPEPPPPPDPRWPRLFAVGAEAAVARLERGGDLDPDRPVAEHGTPAADPAPAGITPNASVVPSLQQQRPAGTSSTVDAEATGMRPEVSTRSGPDEITAGTGVDAAAAGTPPEVSAGPGPHGIAADNAVEASTASTLPEAPAGPGPDEITAGTGVDAAAARPRPGMPVGPWPDAGTGDHDAARHGSGPGPAPAVEDQEDTGRGNVGPSHEHPAGTASTEAAGQAMQDPAPATGPAETGQMASRPPTSASGAPSQAHANMAPAGLSNPSVSGETEGGGGVVNQRPENQSIEEDEAAIAVREAVSRAAAQAGVDVSRETSADAVVERAATTPPGAVVEALGGTPRIDSATAARNARVTFKIHTDGMNGHGRILAVANQKGGVGKSTTAVNLGAYLALAGARVLVVDLDPQGNASTGLGLDHREIEPSIYDVLTGETPPATAIRATTVANLHVLPSTIDLAGAEVELVSAMSREGRLRRALDSIHQFYDTVLIDCPPSLGLLTVNALAAADELLIPIQCEYYALEGLGQLLRNVELVRANLNPELRIGGIVLTMYDGRTRLAEQVVAEVRKHFSDLVYQTVVPRSVRLSEAPGYGLPIALYDPLSRGGIAYRDLAFELAERSGLLAPTGEGAI
jgi:chromosome partitioning protein